MNVAALLSRLEKVRQTGAATWTACCPAHADKSPSLSIRELDDGRVLVHDFGGCPVDDVLAAVGLELSDLFPEKPITHAKGERRPFPAADVLRALASEVCVVLLVAGDMMKFLDLLIAPEDYQRLELAVDRIQAGLNLINGGLRHG